MVHFFISVMSISSMKYIFPLLLALFLSCTTKQDHTETNDNMNERKASGDISGNNGSAFTSDTMNEGGAVIDTSQNAVNDSVPHHDH
jgi:hypothetical protein